MFLPSLAHKDFGVKMKSFGIVLDPTIPVVADALRNWAANAGWQRAKDAYVDGKGETHAGGPPDKGSAWNAIKGAIGLNLHTSLWFDKWSGRPMYEKEPADLDSLTLGARLAIEGGYGQQKYLPHKTPVLDAVTYLCEVQPHNPRTEQIQGVAWDGLERYGRFATAMAQAPDDTGAVEVLKLIVRGIVVRALHPGSDFPYCPIIHSPHQGAGKGLTLKILSGGYHSQVLTGAFGAPNAQQVMMERFRGRSVVEIAEFDGVSGRAQDALKSLVTDGSFAGIRAAYGRQAADWPMTAILVGTTNSDEVLTDVDNRRHPVLTIPDRQFVDLAWLRANVGQLWAQAAAEVDHYFGTLGDWDNIDDGDPITESGHGNLRVQIPKEYWDTMTQKGKAFRQVSPVEDWLAGELTVAKYPGGRVLGGPLLILAKASVGKVSDRYFSEAMRFLGWTRCKQKVDGAINPVSVWETAEATGPPMPPVVSFI